MRNPSSGHLHSFKFTSVSQVPEYEKMPFEVAPVFLYLICQSDAAATEKFAEIGGKVRPLREEQS
jgi:hypothetical protein